MNDESIIIGGLTIAGIAIFGYVGYKNVTDKKDGIKKLSIAGQIVSKETQIPLAFIVTQAAHESNYGRSGLAVKSNNLFGIKAGSSWVGRFDTWPTYEVIGGKEVQVQAKFRKYSSWTESVRDWAELIMRRYPKAYSAALDHDARTFFNELQKGGYATDPSYASKLVGVYQSIEALV